MKCRVPGFTLLEWTLYFFLVMVVITGVFEFVASVRHHIVGLSGQSSLLSHVSVGQDVLVRDVSCAPSKLSEWQELGPTSLAWQRGNKRICWMVESGMLVRREKLFDTQKKVWKSAHKSVIVRGHVLLHVIPLFVQKKGDKERAVAGFHVQLSCGQEGKRVQVQTTVTIKNGRV